MRKFAVGDLLEMAPAMQIPLYDFANINKSSFYRVVECGGDCSNYIVRIVDDALKNSWFGEAWFVKATVPHLTACIVSALITIPDSIELE